MTTNNATDRVGPCTECAETVSAELESCPECGHDARKRAKKHVGYFFLLLAIVSVLFPPAAIVTVPAVPLLYWAYRKHEWLVVDEDSIEPQAE